MTDVDERGTIDSAKRGDALAIKRLVQTNERAVFSLIFRMLRPAGLERETEDIAQEVFLRFFRALHAGRYDENGAARVQTYLLTIACRLAIDRIRAKREDLDSGSRSLALEDSGPSPEEALAAKSSFSQVDAALGRLTAEHRAILLMREAHEMDYEAIAESLGLEIGTVRSRLSRARQAFRDAMNAAKEGE